MASSDSNNAISTLAFRRLLVGSLLSAPAPRPWAAVGPGPASAGPRGDMVAPLQAAGSLSSPHCLNRLFPALPSPMPAAAPAATGTKGIVRQVIGPVLDVEFPAGQLPRIYNALRIETTNPAGQSVALTAEVQQLLEIGRAHV